MRVSGLFESLTLAELAGYILLINVLGYVLIRRGAHQQVVQHLRLPMARLMSVALLGGGLGADLAMRLFASFARRRALRAMLRGIFAAQMIVLALMSTPLGPRLAGALLPDAETAAVQLAERLEITGTPDQIAARPYRVQVNPAWTEKAAPERAAATVIAR